LTSVCSIVPAELEPFPDLKQFSSSEELIRSGEIDAVLIATPHFQHTSMGIDALENGIHIMVEKPISVHKADCERLIQAHEKHPDRVFGAMFQLRAEPRWQKLKKLIDEGELGEIVRINWIISDWYRTEAYYGSSAWRATWKGEGGGVLLNQCPHNLDLMQWLCSPPSKIRGFCQLGRYHGIEVEDNVTFYFECANGATGVFVTSTGEFPGTNRLEISGTRGQIVVENGVTRFTRNESCMLEFSKTAKAGFAKPEVWNVEIPAGNAEMPHAIVLQNFTDAILDGTPLMVPGHEGMHSVEMANAALYSSLTDQTIELPLDGPAYEAKLNQLIADSTFEKKVVESSGEDFTKSFTKQ
jgi:predicted dehydrogenase